jgi:predicted aldo/keto reductase-like oxidoreductase
LDYEVSALGFGMMRLPTVNNDPFSADIVESEAVEMLRYAVDRGLNYVDTAYMDHQGKSEVITGKALKDGYRQKVKLATKSPLVFIKSGNDFDKYLDEQLERLDDEYIDFYLLHAVSGQSWDDCVLRYDLMPKAEKAKKAGKIGSLGFSFHDNRYENFVKVVDAYDGWDFCQIQLNYLDVENQAGLKGLEYAAAKGLAVVIMEPLLGGKLASPPEFIREMMRTQEPRREPVEWALDWLFDLPGTSVVLSGMNDMRQTVENIKYAETGRAGMFTDEDREFIGRVQTAFKSVESIPCTRCGYCLPCPRNVNIPRNFQAYNWIAMFEDIGMAKAEYERMAVFEGVQSRASSCVGCKACEIKCPQKISISELMPKVHSALI